ncbi:MAG: YdeI/OmpD-associated family protein [Candidatus Omnitrophica bacterium]|nr:YdeI/OmpD-associated family protein [Candidatus Omnitrophota bacterium]
MTKKEIADGVVHTTPIDLQKALKASPVALEAWADITPLARNDWICWVEGAKKAETRERRIERTRDDLMAGKRRPCCFPGCNHR